MDEKTLQIIESRLNAQTFSTNIEIRLCNIIESLIKEIRNGFKPATNRVGFQVHPNIIGKKMLVSDVCGGVYGYGFPKAIADAINQLLLQDTDDSQPYCEFYSLDADEDHQKDFEASKYTALYFNNEVLGYLLIGNQHTNQIVGSQELYDYLNSQEF